MLTAAQKNFLRNKGVNYALAELLGNVRQRRYERESSAEVLRRYRNYERTKNEFNVLSKKALNLNMNVRHQIMRLQRVPAHERILFRGQGNNVSRATLRNRIQTLPRNVPKNVNMKEFVRRLNAYEALRPNLNKKRNAYSEAVVHFIRVMAPFGFNTGRFTAGQLTKYANYLSRNLKYQKGKVIGRIVGNRATNPNTAVGRRTIMKMYPGN
jgi:hypothetical protein